MKRFVSSDQATPPGRALRNKHNCQVEMCLVVMLVKREQNVPRFFWEKYDE